MNFGSQSADDSAFSGSLDSAFSGLPQPHKLGHLLPLNENGYASQPRAKLTSKIQANTLKHKGSHLLLFIMRKTGSLIGLMKGTEYIKLGDSSVVKRLLCRQEDLGFDHHTEHTFVPHH